MLSLSLALSLSLSRALSLSLQFLDDFRDRITDTQSSGLTDDSQAYVQVRPYTALLSPAEAAHLTAPLCFPLVSLSLSLFSLLCSLSLSLSLQTYKEQVNGMVAADTRTLFVDHAQCLSFDAPLAQSIADEFIRFEPYIKYALQEFIKMHWPEFLYEENAVDPKDFYVAFYNMPAHIK
jgi:hypothetical protein